VLLPQVCLNRYYAAEGVKAFSLELWKTATIVEGKPIGIDIILAHPQEFVNF